jgi:hypothetical protein
MTIGIKILIFKVIKYLKILITKLGIKNILFQIY